MMRLDRFGWLVVALTLLAGPNLAAQESLKGSFEIGIDAGYADLDKELGDDGTRAVLRLGYHIKPRFQLELQAGSTFVDCEAPCEDFAHFLLNGVFNFQRGPRLVPYLSFGVGMTDLDDDETSPLPQIHGAFDDSTIFQGTAGARYFLGPERRVGVRAELSVMSYENSSNPNFAVGVLWRLGGK